jgi:hypothetical protein
MNSRQRPHPRPRRAATWAATGVLLAVVLGGCGVTIEDHPEPIDPSMVPPVATPTVTVVPDPGAAHPAVPDPDPSTAEPAERPPPTPAR